MGRRAARGGEVEVTELDPKSSTLLPMWFLSIMEAFLTSNTSRNSLEQSRVPINVSKECEYVGLTPGRPHAKGTWIFEHVLEGYSMPFLSSYERA